MNLLDLEFSGKTMMLLGSLTTILILVGAIWLANYYNKKKNSGA